jgi:hypothetical protein
MVVGYAWKIPPRWSYEDRARKDPLSQEGCERLGALIRRRRRQVGFTQQALGVLSGMSQSMISRLETGKLRGINLANLGRIVGALGGLEPTDPLPRRAPIYHLLD